MWRERVRDRNRKNPPWSCSGLNPGHLCDRRMLYPLRYVSSPQVDDNMFVIFLFRIFSSSVSVTGASLSVTQRRSRVSRHHGSFSTFRRVDIFHTSQFLKGGKRQPIAGKADKTFFKKQYF